MSEAGPGQTRDVQRERERIALLNGLTHILFKYFIFPLTLA